MIKVNKVIWVFLIGQKSTLRFGKADPQIDLSLTLFGYGQLFLTL